MKSARGFVSDLTAAKGIRGQMELIEARDSEHAAARAATEERVRTLEAELEGLKGGVNPRSMRMNNRSLRMK